MSEITLEIEKVVAYDGQDSMFVVKCEDSHCANIEIHYIVHTLESWREMSAKVEEAIKMLGLKE